MTKVIYLSKAGPVQDCYLDSPKNEELIISEKMELVNIYTTFMTTPAEIIVRRNDDIIQDLNEIFMPNDRLSVYLIGEARDPIVCLIFNEII